MRDQATALRERLRPQHQVAEVWAVATLGGERGSLPFAREIRGLMGDARLKVCLWGDQLQDANVVLLPAGEGLKGVRRAYMRGAHTWLLLCPATSPGLGECLELLRELSDRCARAVYLALSGVSSVQEGDQKVARFVDALAPELPYQPEPFGFYGPNERGVLTLAPAALKRFFAGGR